MPIAETWITWPAPVSAAAAAEHALCAGQDRFKGIAVGLIQDADQRDADLGALNSLGELSGIGDIGLYRGDLADRAHGFQEFQALHDAAPVRNPRPMLCQFSNDRAPDETRSAEHRDPLAIHPS